MSLEDNLRREAKDMIFEVTDERVADGVEFLRHLREHIDAAETYLLERRLIAMNEELNSLGNDGSKAQVFCWMEVRRQCSNVKALWDKIRYDLEPGNRN